MQIPSKENYKEMVRLYDDCCRNLMCSISRGGQVEAEALHGRVVSGLRVCSCVSVTEQKHKQTKNEGL